VSVLLGRPRINSWNQHASMPELVCLSILTTFCCAWCGGFATHARVANGSQLCAFHGAAQWPSLVGLADSSAGPRQAAGDASSSGRLPPAPRGGCYRAGSRGHWSPAVLAGTAILAGCTKQDGPGERERRMEISMAVNDAGAASAPGQAAGRPGRNGQHQACRPAGRHPGRAWPGRTPSAPDPWHPGRPWRDRGRSRAGRRPGCASRLGASGGGAARPPRLELHGQSHRPWDRRAHSPATDRCVHRTDVPIVALSGRWATPTPRRLHRAVERGHRDGTIAPDSRPPGCQYLLWSQLYAGWSYVADTGTSRHDAVRLLVRTMVRAVRP
jgi:hypothetical protein